MSHTVVNLGLRQRASRIVAAVLVLVAAVLASTPSAQAEFGGATLLSGTPQLQFDEADAPALAGEGRYAVFQGSLGGMTGVYRRDLSSGATEPVATGEPAHPAISASDASAPSVSANGRYVAFTTTADLEPEHLPTGGGAPEGEPPADEGCPEVYVRDMELPATAPGAYTLASALNGSGEGMLFAGGCAAESFAVAGAQAAPGVALSADGHRVVFTVLSSSNLATGPGGEATTPPSQVAVRDLETDTTTLVTATPEGNPTPGGGAYPSEQAEQHMHSSTAAPTLIANIGNQITGSTAAISADGSTVAWLGTNVPAQVPGSGPEIEAGTFHEAGTEAPASEAEPLWRRVADGPSAFTRRLLAGAGLDLFYSREQPDEIVTAGSLVGTGSLPLFIAPALSENGEAVALVSNAPRPAAVRSAELGEGAPTTDAYAVHVEDAPTVPVQVTPLTETPDYKATPQALGFVDDIAISPAGDRVAFDAQRTQFTLPSLALVSPPVSYTGDSETYEANLGLGTLQRVSVTYDGSQPSGSAGLLAFSANGRGLAFASQATNLFYGDAMKASQVYITEELSNIAPPAPQQLGVAPEEALPAEEWRLNATAFARPNGSVQVNVRTPSAGTLTVAARAQLPSFINAVEHGAGRSRSAAHEGRGSAAIARAKLLTRTIGKVTKHVGVAGELRLEMSVTGGYRALVANAHGLYALLRVSFTAPGHTTLVQEIPATFHRTTRAKATRGADR